MNTALARRLLQQEMNLYKELAINNMQFLLKNFQYNDTVEFFHTWKNNIAKYPAFLDDYAFLNPGLDPFTGNNSGYKLFEKAKMITEHVIENFSESETSFFLLH